MCSAPALSPALVITDLQNPRDFTFKQAWHYFSIHSYKLLLLTIILQRAKQEIFKLKYIILIYFVLSKDVRYCSFKCYSKQFGLQQEETFLIFHISFFFTKGLMFQSFKIKDSCKKIKSIQNNKKTPQENQTKP